MTAREQLAEKPKWRRPRGKCLQCGKIVALNAPSGDWLLALYPRKHEHGGNLCEGMWREITKLI